MGYYLQAKPLLMSEATIKIGAHHIGRLGSIGYSRAGKLKCVSPGA